MNVPSTRRVTPDPTVSDEALVNVQSPVVVISAFTSSDVAADRVNDAQLNALARTVQPPSSLLSTISSNALAPASMILPTAPALKVTVLPL